MQGCISHGCRGAFAVGPGVRVLRVQGRICYGSKDDEMTPTGYMALFIMGASFTKPSSIDFLCCKMSACIELQARPDAELVIIYCDCSRVCCRLLRHPTSLLGKKSSTHTVSWFPSDSCRRVLRLAATELVNRRCLAYANAQRKRLKPQTLNPI